MGDAMLALLVERTGVPEALVRAVLGALREIEATGKSAAQRERETKREAARQARKAEREARERAKREDREVRRQAREVEREGIARRNLAMIEAYREGGRSYDSIGAEHGISHERVHQILAARGVTPEDKGRGSTLSKIQVAEAVRLHAETRNVTEVARRLGMGYTIVWNALHHAGVDTSPAARPWHCYVCKRTEGEGVVPTTIKGGKGDRCVACNRAGTNAYYHRDREQARAKAREYVARRKATARPTRLRALRLAAGLEQQELAALAGLSDGSVSNWEAGKSAPRAASLRKLADALGLPEAEVAGAIGEPLA